MLLKNIYTVKKLYSFGKECSCGSKCSYAVLYTTRHEKPYAKIDSYKCSKCIIESILSINNDGYSCFPFKIFAKLVKQSKIIVESKLEFNRILTNSKEVNSFNIEQTQKPKRSVYYDERCIFYKV